MVIASILGRREVFPPGCFGVRAVPRVRTSTNTPDRDKFRELILLVAELSEGDRPFGATKLNKLLFYIDFLAFLLHGKAVTGQRYQKLENGPAPRALVPVTKEMEAQEEIAFVTRNYHGKEQRRIVALRSPDLSGFSGQEVQLINDIIEECRGKSAAEMSEMSHQFIGWELAELGEDIPYEVALVGTKKPSKEVLREATKLESMAKECLKHS
jgi:hypothetical protein